MNYRSLYSVLTLISMVGCASLQGAPTAPRTRNVITQEMIARMNVGTAYDVLAQQLNRSPSAPTRGGATSFTRPQAPVVVIDGTRSEVAALQGVPAAQIELIRILDAREGTLLYGTGAVNGVIVLTTRRQ